MGANLIKGAYQGNMIISIWLYNTITNRTCIGQNASNPLYYSVKLRYTSLFHVGINPNLTKIRLSVFRSDS